MYLEGSYAVALCEYQTMCEHATRIENSRLNCNELHALCSECEFIFNETQLLPIVSVETFQVQELDLDLRTLSVQNFGPLSDGATVEWNSTSSQNVTDESKIPGGLQFNIVGKTASGLTIVNSAIVQYSNNGNVSPIFEVGDQIGWTVFVSTCYRLLLLVA